MCARAGLADSYGSADYGCSYADDDRHCVSYGHTDYLSHGESEPNSDAHTNRDFDSTTKFMA